MAQNTFCRKEKKMLVDSSLVPAIKERMLEFMQTDKHNIDGQAYEINNIYFDDENDDIIRYSLTKPYYKEKLRLRSYGTPAPDSNVFLEIKKKQAGIGTKRRAVLKYADAQKYLETGEHPEGLSYIDEQVLKEIDYYLSVYPVRPKAYVSYLRNAYLGKNDKNFRVTFDSEILSRRTDVDLSLGRYGTPLLPEGKTLLEVKFIGAVPLEFVKIMSDFGLSFGTYTKYGVSFKQAKALELNTEIYKY